MGSTSVKVGLQVAASEGHDLHFVDVTEAFLQGDRLIRPGGRLFLEPPAEGLPSVEPGSIVEIVVNVYGLNDAPRAWHKVLMRTLTSVGWRATTLVACYLTLRQGGKVVGQILLHVDDMLITGRGRLFASTLAAHQRQHEFGSWKTGAGEFLGAMVRKHPCG